VLTFMYRNCWRPNKDGGVYSASVNTLATACGHGRDTKAIALLVEPWLLQVGLLEVRPTGRTLTAAGVERARQLVSLGDADPSRASIHETPAARAMRALEKTR